MVTLETKRLKIVALDMENLELRVKDFEKMEQNLGVVPSGHKDDIGLLDAMKEGLRNARKDIENYIWYTNWQIILKEENVIIGSASFKNAPDFMGEVELGYGINRKYQGKGYMTEAAKTMVEWALSQDNIYTIIAETLKKNVKSHRVLEKCGFEICNETGANYWWRKGSGE